MSEDENQEQSCCRCCTCDCHCSCGKKIASAIRSLADAIENCCSKKQFAKTLNLGNCR